MGDGDGSRAPGWFDDVMTRRPVRPVRPVGDCRWLQQRPIDHHAGLIDGFVERRVWQFVGGFADNHWHSDDDRAYVDTDCRVDGLRSARNDRRSGYRGTDGRSSVHGRSSHRWTHADHRARRQCQRHHRHPALEQ